MMRGEERKEKDDVLELQIEMRTGRGESFVLSFHIQ
jgi:hypothetical protein